jgi:hypothetical protein
MPKMEHLVNPGGRGFDSVVISRAQARQLQMSARLRLAKIGRHGGRPSMAQLEGAAPSAP